MELKTVIKYMILGILLWLPPAPAAAELESSLDYSYYTVSITSKEDACQNAFAVTPIKVDGQKYIGLSYWQIDYNYTYNRNADACQVDAHKTTHTCTVTLPKFVGGEALLQRILAVYVEKLKRHELTHCQISREYAEKFDQRLNRLGRRQCADLAEAIK